MITTRRSVGILATMGRWGEHLSQLTGAIYPTEMLLQTAGHRVRAGEASINPRVRPVSPELK
ncbi:hypothetical protein ABZU76_17845 [Amycolatopsis sp. NPDC005232]|uniref:hypothetical protein n=1 Tax=Amycolatopsis sp. NPDC005232 TaxID=3157027 RepID=UPI0033B7017B